MCIGKVKQRRRTGFTLLEITLAVAILAMVAMAIYRFVATNLAAVRLSAIENATDARYNGFVNLLTSQMQELSTAGGVTGQPFKFSDQSQDEMSWICGSGPGLLTRYAAGEYIVTMRLKRAEGNGNRMDIGFVRKPRDTAEGSDEGVSWVTVLENVRSLQIRYYDSRLPDWVDKWTDTNVMPRLVRLIIGRPDRSEPLETVIALARTHLPIQLPQPQLPQQPNGGQLAPGAAPQGVAPGSQPPGKGPAPGSPPAPGGQPPKK